MTISDVNINTSDAAVSTSGKGNVNIELDGTNTLKSGVNHAGLEKNSDGNQGKLTITDENENGKLIDFKVTAFDEEGLIGEGTHRRAIISNERFLQKCNDKRDRVK